MDMNKRLISCRKCTKREFNIIDGTVCSITSKLPTFKNKCSDYEEDALEIKKLQNTIHREPLEEKVSVQGMSIYSSVSSEFLKLSLRFFRTLFSLLLKFKAKK